MKEEMIGFLITVAAIFGGLLLFTVVYNLFVQDPLESAQEKGRESRIADYTAAGYVVDEYGYPVGAEA
jgi:hypothetical protein